MKNVKFTLVDNNFTSLNKAEIAFNSEEIEKLKALLCKLGDGLMAEHSRHLCIEGLVNTPIDLTITDYENGF